MRVLVLVLMSVLLVSCSSAPYNPTVFNYDINEEVVRDKNFKRLIIAPINLGKPSRIYLEKKEELIDRKVTHFLQANGYTVSSSKLFASRWKEAVRKYGEVFNPSTGKLTKSFQPALAETVKYLTENANIDGVVFTDLIEREVQFSSGVSHHAKWDGVSRKPSLQGPGEGVPMDFNWSQSINAVSLYINVFDKDLQRVFSGMGGIQVTQAISLKGASPKFVRRRKVLGNNSEIHEGIKLAFHPLIEMSDYPRKE